MKTKEQRILLVALSALAVVAFLSWGLHRGNVRTAQNRKLQTLYAYASGGDLNRLKLLADDPSPEAQEWLEKLAQDRTAFAEARVAAIKSLVGRPRIDHTSLNPLIQIDEPFVVRHATAEFFEQHGCSESCVGTTLQALHAIWQGKPTLEMKPDPRAQAYGISPRPDLTSSLRKQSERDYLEVLGSNACAAQKILTRDYSSESEFVIYVREKMKPC
jgi:hypothetical protein